MGPATPRANPFPRSSPCALRRSRCRCTFWLCRSPAIPPGCDSGAAVVVSSAPLRAPPALPAVSVNDGRRAAGVCAARGGGWPGRLRRPRLLCCHAAAGATRSPPCSPAWWEWPRTPPRRAPTHRGYSCAGGVVPAPVAPPARARRWGRVDNRRPRPAGVRAHVAPRRGRPGARGGHPGAPRGLWSWRPAGRPGRVADPPRRPCPSGGGYAGRHVPRPLGAPGRAVWVL